MLLAFVIPALLYPLSREACVQAFGHSSGISEPIFLPRWLVGNSLRLSGDSNNDEASSLRTRKSVEPSGQITFINGVLVFGVVMAVLALLDTIVIDAHIDTTGWWRRS